MICCSIANKSIEAIPDLLGRVEMAEVRLDSCSLTDSDIEELFLDDIPLVATCRAVDGDYIHAEQRLLLAIRSGAQYADLEIEAPVGVSRRVSQACRQYGTVLIRSFHDFDGCPDLGFLRGMVDRCRNMDGEIVKIAVTASSDEDVERVLSLYRYYEASGLIAFAMGECGKRSRIECLAKGAPFSYACPDGEKGTAPGQIPYSLMKEKVYGNLPQPSFPVLRMPSSKSYAQRAIIAAALSGGLSRLHAYTPCADSEAALEVAAAMGAEIRRIPAPLTGETSATDAASATDGKTPASAGPFTLEILGKSPSRQPGAEPGVKRFEVGESGLLSRLMIPLAARMYGSHGAVIDGCGTLLNRSLEGAGTAMRALGAEVTPLQESALPQADITLPVRVSGPLRGGRAELDGSRSSQLISGLLMALPMAARNSTLLVHNPVSIPYIYMTMEILRKFGIRTRSEMSGDSRMLDRDWNSCRSLQLRIRENQEYKPCEMTLEADWSAASAFLAAGAIFGGVKLEGLDTGSIQPDIMMLDVLMEAGASLSQEDEPKGVITVRKSPLRSFEADLSDSPDLFPVVAVLCAFCQGKSLLAGVRRLTHKESDRAAAILAMLSGLGVKANVEKDVMSINGESLSSRCLSSRLLHGGAFSSSHDHRMVMALRLAELGADAPITIDDEACVGKSFPGFTGIFNKIV